MANDKFYFAVIEQYEANDKSPAHGLLAEMWGLGTFEQAARQASIYHQKLTGVPLDDDDIEWLRDSGFIIMDDEYWATLGVPRKFPWTHTLKVGESDSFGD